MDYNFLFGEIKKRGYEVSLGSWKNGTWTCHLSSEVEPSKFKYVSASSGESPYKALELAVDKLNKDLFCN